ncbi:MAG: metallophosphoesterase family protein [Flavobacteriales bacterium]|nr:metallophosphoesterase family protein [Flavobacteriales bacterium]
MKKIGIISDTHGFTDPKYAKYFGSCDEIWHAGDIGDLSVTDELSKIAPVRAVYGNIDNHLIRSEFPLHQRFYCEKVSVWITHIGGKPYVYSKNIKEEIERNPPRIFVCGHSHICKVQMDKKLNMLYINPGAAGVKGFHKVRTLIRFEIDQYDIRNMEVIELGTR